MLKKLFTSEPEPQKKKRVGKPFQKGHDPRRNMQGRPKLGTLLSDMVRDALDEAIEGDYTKRDALIDLAIAKAQKGDFRFLSWLFERGYGKVPDVVELKQSDGDEIDFSTWDAEDLKNYEILLKKYHTDRG